MKFKIAEPIQDEDEVEAQLVIDCEGHLSLFLGEDLAVTISKDNLALHVHDGYSSGETPRQFSWKF